MAKKNNYFIDGWIRDITGKPIDKVKMPMDKYLCYIEYKYNVEKPKKNPYKRIL